MIKNEIVQTQIGLVVRNLLHPNKFELGILDIPTQSAGNAFLNVSGYSQYMLPEGEGLHAGLILKLFSQDFTSFVNLVPLTYSLIYTDSTNAKLSILVFIDVQDAQEDEVQSLLVEQLDSLSVTYNHKQIKITDVLETEHSNVWDVSYDIKFENSDEIQISNMKSDLLDTVLLSELANRVQTELTETLTVLTDMVEPENSVDSSVENLEPNEETLNEDSAELEEETTEEDSNDFTEKDESTESEKKQPKKKRKTKSDK